MEVVLDGVHGILAADWTAHVTTRPGGGYDLVIERRGRRLSIEAAMETAELLSTSSFAASKVAIFPGPKR